MSRHFVGLVQHRRLIIQRLMESFAIVKQFNVLKDLYSCLVSRLIIPMVNDLVFERAEEAFRHRVVIVGVIGVGSLGSWVIGVLWSLTGH